MLASLKEERKKEKNNSNKIANDFVFKEREEDGCFTRSLGSFRGANVADLAGSLPATNRRTVVESAANYFRSLAKRANFASGRQLSRFQPLDLFARISQRLYFHKYFHKSTAYHLV